MTPLEYLQRYYNLEVPVENEQGTTEWVKVKISCYRLGEDGLNSRETFLNKLRPHLDEKGETITVKVKSIYGEEAQTFRSRGEIAPFVAAPFFGKGSPEDVQIVLQLAVRYGLIGKTQADIQKYCEGDEKAKTQMGRIGLDCNGFVGNFLRHSIGGRQWVEKPGKNEYSWASTGITTLMKDVGKRITKMDDFVFSEVYVLGLVNSAGKIIDRKEGKTVGHVAISQPLTLLSKAVYKDGKKIGEHPALQVVEATGRGKGLVESEYEILEVDKTGVFNVWRGSQQEEKRFQIYRVFGF